MLVSKVYATVPGQFIFNSNFIFHDLYVSVVLKEAKRGYWIPLSRGEGELWDVRHGHP